MLYIIFHWKEPSTKPMVSVATVHLLLVCELNVIIKSKSSPSFMLFCFYAYSMYFNSIRALPEPEMQQMV